MGDINADMTNKKRDICIDYHLIIESRLATQFVSIVQFIILNDYLRFFP